MKDTVRIVVADDEPIIRIDLCQLLEELGHQVVGQAADGFDALECCRRSRPDLAILDIRMPVFDGLSAAQSILEEGAAGGVILLTAFLDDELISRATAIGVSGYLVKPIERRMLQPTLQVALAQNRRLAQARQEIEATEEKLAQAKVVDRAKAVLAAREGISEAEAYREHPAAHGGVCAGAVRTPAGAAPSQSPTDGLPALVRGEGLPHDPQLCQ